MEKICKTKESFCFTLVFENPQSKVNTHLLHTLKRSGFCYDKKHLLNAEVRQYKIDQMINILNYNNGEHLKSRHLDVYWANIFISHFNQTCQQ